MKIKYLIGVLIVAGLVFTVMNIPKKNIVLRAEEATITPEVSSITKLIEASNSDGQYRLVGSSELIKGSVHYSFRVEDAAENSSLLLFETKAADDETYSIPFNSWSSDNKYLFLQLNNSKGKNYYVFKADASLFADGLKYLDVGDYWSQGEREDVIKEVSGWAGPDLLMVYTTKPDGTGSSAYWFMVSSRKFMQVREF